MDERRRVLELLERGAEREREHDLGPARELLTAALDAASAADLPDIACPCRSLLGIVAHKADRLVEARAHLEMALALALSTGDRTDEAYIHQELGFLLLDEGRPQPAMREFQAELALAPGARIINLAGNGLSGTGVALLQLGRPVEAVPFLLGALTIRAEIGDLEQQHVDLVHLAAAALALGDPTTAARVARFLERDTQSSRGTYGHDRRALRNVLDATADVTADPANGFEEARRLTAVMAASD